jgi:hypothetical protein
VTGDRLDEWLATHGEPSVDLTDATREDLLDYKRSREGRVKVTSWQAKSGPIGVFYGYAKSAGWTDVDPAAMGHGTRRRNTFRGRALITRHIRFLTWPRRWLIVGGVRNRSY